MAKTHYDRQLWLDFFQLHNTNVAHTMDKEVAPFFWMAWAAEELNHHYFNADTAAQHPQTIMAKTLELSAQHVC